MIKEIFVPEYDKKVIIERPSNDIFQKQGIVKEKLTNGLVNYDKIQGVVILRNKQDGDSIRLARRNHTTKLKKLYNSLKLTDEERQSAPCYGGR
ncbi:MAG: tRNA lysidine(34) synthetase TilS [Ruminococcus sp.]|nr:MAG: tRNA lysidine(34) synthetase TilS [Ruminococcus sp.]